MMQPDPEIVDQAAVAAALRRQADDPDDHDRSLITERLSWTPQQRLDANVRTGDQAAPFRAQEQAE